MLREHDADLRAQPTARSAPFTGIHSYQINGHAGAGSSGCTSGWPCNANYFSSLGAAALPAGHLQGDQPPAQLRRQPSGHLGRAIRSASRPTAAKSSPTTSDPTVFGSLPRIIVQPRRKADLRACRSISAPQREYGHCDPNSKTGLVVNDTRPDPHRSRSRPCAFRSPSCSFLTFNSSLGLHDTYWTESLREQRAGRPIAVTRRLLRHVHAASRARCSRGSGTRPAALRAEVQARDRADLSRSAAPRRSTTTPQHREARRHGLHRRQRHQLNYGVEQPPVREEGQRARDRDRSPSTRATTPTPNASQIRPQLSEQRTSRRPSRQLLARHAISCACLRRRPRTTHMRTEYDTQDALAALVLGQRRGQPRAARACDGRLEPSAEHPVRADRPNRTDNFLTTDANVSSRRRQRQGLLPVQLRSARKVFLNQRIRSRTTRSAAASRSSTRTFNYATGERPIGRRPAGPPVQPVLHPRGHRHVSRTSSARSGDSSIDEGTDSQRRQGHAPAPAHLHQRQAAGAGRQQAGAVLRHRGARRGRHHATSASSSATRRPRSAPRSATDRAGACGSPTSSRTRRAGWPTRC